MGRPCSVAQGRARQSQAGCSLTIALLSYLYSSEQGSSLSQVRELEKFRRRGRSEKWAESYICTQVHRAPIAFSPFLSRTCSRRITTVIIFASMLFLVLFKSKVVTSTASHTVIYGYLEFECLNDVELCMPFKHDACVHCAGSNFLR